MTYTAHLLPIIAALSLATSVYTNGCVQAYGPVVPADARAAAASIPLPYLNPQATTEEQSGRLVLQIPVAAHHIHVPVTFFFGRAIIDVWEIDYPNRAGPSGGLSLTEQALYLWPRLKLAALEIVARCVEPSQGNDGGWESFWVAPGARPMRRFRANLRGTVRTAMALKSRRDGGFSIWPRPMMFSDDG